jgi:hypothetical protein
VREDLEAGFVAVCCCGDGNCPPLRLDPAQTAIYELDLGSLSAAVAQGLNLSGSSARSGPKTVVKGSEQTRSQAQIERPVPDWRQLGHCQCGPLRAPAYFLVPSSQASLLAEIEELLCNTGGPFLLVLPSRRHLTNLVQRAIHRHSCATLTLDGVLVPGDAGHFMPIRSLDDLVGSLTARMAESTQSGDLLRAIHEDLAALRKELGNKQPAAASVDEDVAASAFALVKALDAQEKSRMDNPSILTVFRLYCIEELSAGEIAKRFTCAKQTIIRRLNLIRTRTRTDPIQLRRFSAHFSKLEEQLTDPRAGRIHRKSMIFDDEDEEE